MPLKRKKNQNSYLALKPFIEEFANVGIKLRIERGDFKSNACWVNGDFQVFINKRLSLDDQKKMIENLKMRDDIRDIFENTAERNIIDE
jgi:hypothetical protein